MSLQLCAELQALLGNIDLPKTLLFGTVTGVASGLILQRLIWAHPRASSEAVSVARQALASAASVFSDSIASGGKVRHPWVVGDLKLDHRALESQLVDARDRIASRKFRKHVDEVRTELQGLLDTKALSWAAMGSSTPHITTDAEAKRKRESNERAEQQLKHAQRGDLAVQAALRGLSRVSSRR